ncbi:MAG TPA: hypothetical protein DCF68_01460 [Cyanothece sp. UBA12306]|nr:hypothetical protein [Cyanothece sp. UBA12306]
MTNFTESIVEQAILDWLTQLGYITSQPKAIPPTLPFLNCQKQHLTSDFVKTGPMLPNQKIC